MPKPAEKAVTADKIDKEIASHIKTILQNLLLASKLMQRKIRKQNNL